MTDSSDAPNHLPTSVLEGLATTAARHLNSEDLPARQEARVVLALLARYPDVDLSRAFELALKLSRIGRDRASD